MDEFDDFEGLDDFSGDLNPELNTTTQNTDQDDLDDWVSSFLQSKGIEDKSKIKFEDEMGTLEEKDWDSLNTQEKLNILNSSDPQSDLDDYEIQLINSMRSSGMSPAEYLQYIAQNAVNNYVQNTQTNSMRYSVDLYNDDDLYVLDLMSRTDMTREEALETLDRVKTNETQFAKLIGAIRNEYKAAEEEQIRQALFEQQQAYEQQYQEYSNNVANCIQNFKEFAGYELNMDREEMQELYEFLTGVDPAGNNHFSKALANPETQVKLAWFALHGQRLINDITDYFKKEITNVERNSYAKGKLSASKDNKTVVYNKKQTKSKFIDDLDDF